MAKKDWVMRAVIEQEQRPYDRDINGVVLTTTMDVLECGHKIPATQPELLGRGHRNLMTTHSVVRTRRCRRCEKKEISRG